MSKLRLGDISLKDYQKIIGAPRRRWWKPYGVLLLTLCAGWYGGFAMDAYNTPTHSLEVGIDNLEHRWELTEDQARLATAIVRRRTLEGLDVLLALSADEGTAGEEARAGIGHIRRRLNR